MKLQAILIRRSLGWNKYKATIFLSGMFGRIEKKDVIVRKVDGGDMGSIYGIEENTDNLSLVRNMYGETFTVMFERELREFKKHDNVTENRIKNLSDTVLSLQFENAELKSQVQRYSGASRSNINVIASMNQRNEVLNEELEFLKECYSGELKSLKERINHLKFDLRQLQYIIDNPQKKLRTHKLKL